MNIPRSVLAREMMRVFQFSSRDFTTRASGDDGRLIELINDNSSSESFPFLVASTTVSGDLKFTVTPGTFNGIYPTLDGTSINDVPAPIGDLGAGERFVYLRVTFTLLDTDGYVYAGTLTAAEIVVEMTEETDPLGPNATGVFYIMLASFNDGVKTGQPTTTSLVGGPIDDGTAAESAYLDLNEA